MSAVERAPGIGGALSSRATAGALGAVAGRVDSGADLGISLAGVPFGEGCGAVSLARAVACGSAFVSDAGVVPAGHALGAEDALGPGAVPVPGEALGAEAVVVRLEAEGLWTS